MQVSAPQELELVPREQVREPQAQVWEPQELELVLQLATMSVLQLAKDCRWNLNAILRTRK